MQQCTCFPATTNGVTSYNELHKKAAHETTKKLHLAFLLTTAATRNTHEQHICFFQLLQRIFYLASFALHFLKVLPPCYHGYKWAIPKLFGCWPNSRAYQRPRGGLLWVLKKTKQTKDNNTCTITHVCIQVLLFILFAQNHVCNVTYENDSFVA